MKKTKKCPDCKKTKSLEGFGVNGKGWRTHCKICRGKRNGKWRIRNKWVTAKKMVEGVEYESNKFNDRIFKLKTSNLSNTYIAHCDLLDLSKGWMPLSVRFGEANIHKLYTEAKFRGINEGV